ncbi:MAG: hypothetical protein CM1200mP9_08610 [Gammaproteobacteria bacterium]|nr:MAG: hypothetical protein CM1200mP9_08610 [Gammaproteobacteria bacterium]
MVAMFLLRTGTGKEWLCWSHTSVTGKILSYYFASKGPLNPRSMRIVGFRGIEEQVISARERHGGRLVPPTRGGLRTLLLALRRGELVVVLPDQVPARGNGVMANFMKTSALTGTLSHRLIQKNGGTRLPSDGHPGSRGV